MKKALSIIFMLAINVPAMAEVIYGLVNIEKQPPFCMVQPTYSIKIADETKPTGFNIVSLQDNNSPILMRLQHDKYYSLEGTYITYGMGMTVFEVSGIRQGG